MKALPAPDTLFPLACAEAVEDVPLAVFKEPESRRRDELATYRPPRPAPQAIDIKVTFVQTSPPKEPPKQKLSAAQERRINRIKRDVRKALQHCGSHAVKYHLTYHYLEEGKFDRAYQDAVACVNALKMAMPHLKRLARGDYA